MAMKPFAPGDVVLGQFEGYGNEDDVEAGSRTDTFAAVRAEIDTDRWRGVVERAGIRGQ